MKVGILLVVALGASTSHSSTNKTGFISEVETPLQRLAAYRRSNLNKNPTKRTVATLRHNLQIPLDASELLQLFNSTESLVEASGGLLEPGPKPAEPLTVAIEEEGLQSPDQSRLKRAEYRGGYVFAGPGAKSLAPVVTNQLLGDIIGLSTAMSRGSSKFHGYHQPVPVYGPTNYRPAVKAVGGGVLALKGQLLKGGGFLVSSKGHLISSAGQAITGLGKKLASSTVVQPPPHFHQAYEHKGYAYEAPRITDDTIQPGLFIAKPRVSVGIDMEELKRKLYSNRASAN